MLDKVIDSLSIRNFKKIITYTTLIESKILAIAYPNLSFEDYCNLVNSTKFKKRAFEDINYCACCEEININNLQAIHLDFTKELDNPMNSIILCKENARLYYDGKFEFSKTGKIIIYNKTYDLDKRMHMNKKLAIDKNKFLVENE